MMQLIAIGTTAIKKHHGSKMIKQNCLVVPLHLNCYMLQMHFIELFNGCASILCIFLQFPMWKLCTFCLILTTWIAPLQFMKSASRSMQFISYHSQTTTWSTRTFRPVKTFHTMLSCTFFLLKCKKSICFRFAKGAKSGTLVFKS